jgi:hypothetical protein
MTAEKSGSTREPDTEQQSKENHAGHWAFEEHDETLPVDAAFAHRNKATPMGNGSLTRVEGKSERKNTPRLQICAARDSQSGNRNLLAVMEALLESGETNRDWQLRTKRKESNSKTLQQRLLGPRKRQNPCTGKTEARTLDPGCRIHGARPRQEQRKWSLFNTSRTKTQDCKSAKGLTRTREKETNDIFILTPNKITNDSRSSPSSLSFDWN